MNLGVRRDVHFYVTLYASNPSMRELLVPRGPKNKSFNIGDLTFFMFPTFKQ
jgi:hypothetical protein